MEDAFPKPDPRLVGAWSDALLPVRDVGLGDVGPVQAGERVVRIGFWLTSARDGPQRIGVCFALHGQAEVLDVQGIPNTPAALAALAGHEVLEERIVECRGSEVVLPGVYACERYDGEIIFL